MKTVYDMVVEKLGSSIENVSVNYMTDISGCCQTIANFEHNQTIILNEDKLRMQKRLAVQFLNEQTLERADDFYKTYTDLQYFGVM